MSFVMGDAEVLFECKNRHIWSYHYYCPKSNNRCSSKPGEFIGWALHDQDEDNEVVEAATKFAEAIGKIMHNEQDKSDDDIDDQDNQENHDNINNINDKDKLDDDESYYDINEQDDKEIHNNDNIINNINDQDKSEDKSYDDIDEQDNQEIHNNNNNNNNIDDHQVKLDKDLDERINQEIRRVENHKLFKKEKIPCGINYIDGSVFIWKCTICDQKYMNCMCG
jgi:hypothetical protein